MKKLVSNSKGISLLTHSKAVEKITKMMSNRLCLPDDIAKSACKSGLLHDIGKIYSVFQNYVSKDIVSEEFISNKILHNEVSWAMLKYLLDYRNEESSNILYTAYWHHSKDMSGEDKEYASSILDKISNNDKIEIINFYNILTNENKSLKDIDIEINDDKIPEYYLNKKDKNSPRNTAILSCVISADRIVSTADQDRILIDNDYCNKLIDKLDYSESKSYVIPPHYNIDRFNYQLACVNDLKNSKTNILKGPAGFGKTLTGLLSWIDSGNRKLIWVCPRNQVAESLYKSVLEELKAIGLEDASVQLFLTGKIQESHNCKNNESFTSDIVITNIDNFLTPTINNYVRIRMYSMLSNYVIFDEFHELVASEPYFACFVNIMQTRHRLTNSKTLLMSATPSLISHLWDTPSNKTGILPDEKHHYDAAHSKKFKINLISNINNITPKKNHLFITNAISSSQKETIDKNYSLLIHSKFTDTDRKKLVQEVYELYGKNKPLELKKDVISAPLIQAAMDISFGEITEILKSAEDSFQRLGRNNRWGEYDCVNFNIIVDVKNKNIKKRELNAIKTTYNIELSNLWSDFLKNNIIKDNEYILDELYKIYNNFNIKHKSEIEQYVNRMYMQSITSLSKLYPKKYINKKDSSETKANVSKLRDNGSNKIYCIYPIFNSDEFTDPFNIDDNSSDMDDKEDNTTQNNQLRVVKKLLKDERFEYNEYSLYKKGEKFTSRKLMAGAKNIKTPYICFHKTYHPKFGLTDNKILKSLN